MGLFDRKFLNAEKVKGFDNYKYCCIDNSPLAVYVSHPFWNWIVNFYPTWLAPNVLTLAGAALVTTCYFFVLWMDWELSANSYGSPDSQNLPAWMWLACGVCTFLAHLLDGTDGKQARRTGASGPTGELFDHGLDSWSTIPFTLTIFSIFGQGAYSIAPVRLLGVLISVQLVFVVTHWEKYNTGVFFLSWAYDASQYGLSVFYVLTYFIGHKAFQLHVVNGITFATVFEMGFYVCCVLSYVMSFYNLYVSYFVDKTGKQKNFYEFILPMISPAILFAVSLYWAIHSPLRVIDTHPRLFCWTMGIVFSNIAVHLTINQMTLTRAQLLNKMLLFYGAIALAAVCGLLGNTELLALEALCAMVAIVHIYYSVCVVRQLCDHFKINAFSLKYLEERNRPKVQ